MKNKLDKLITCLRCMISKDFRDGYNNKLKVAFEKEQDEAACLELYYKMKGRHFVDALLVADDLPWHDISRYQHCTLLAIDAYGNVKALNRSANRGAIKFSDAISQAHKTGCIVLVCTNTERAGAFMNSNFTYDKDKGVYI